MLYLLSQMPGTRIASCIPIGKQFVQDVIFGLNLLIAAIFT